MKIFGSDGAECTFRSPFQTSTRQLQFLENKGALLRLTTVSVCTLPGNLPCSQSSLEWCGLGATHVCSTMWSNMMLYRGSC